MKRTWRCARSCKRCKRSRLPAKRICGRCAREFVRENLHQLTVHHRDHNHDNNPSDGSNWELLCLYCHDNEHARELDHDAAQRAGINGGKAGSTRATAQPFANLKDLLKKG